jgi:TRAP-type C4-dicarboxylate transport system permease small subunit
VSPGRTELLARLDRLGRLLENVALVILLGGMMLVQVGQIVMRELFSSGFIWADELLKLAVLWLAMIAAVAACRDNRHIRVDALSHLLSKSAIRVTRAIVDLFAAIVCAVVAWHAFRYMRLEIEFQDKVLIAIPAWLAHSVVPVAFALTAYRFAVGAVRTALGASDDEQSVLP